MDFSLTKEQRAFRDSVHEFAIKEIRPVETKLDKLENPQAVFDSEEFWNVIKKGFKTGYHKILIPESAGGPGMADPIYWVIMAEELAWGGAGLASTFIVSSMGFVFMAMWGLDKNPDLRDNYFKHFIEDNERYMGAWAVTEPECGSDIFEKKVPGLKFNTTAKKDGDYYIINGSKAAWVTNGGLAKLYLLHATIEPEKGWLGTGIFIVPRDIEGVSVGKPLDKMGLRVLNQAEVYFDNVRVPKSYLYFEPTPLYHNILETIASAGNTMVATLALGVARASYEEALAYAKERIQGGKPIIEHPNVGLKLFDAYARINASRNMIYWAASSGMAGQPENLKYAAACRWIATDTCTRVTEEMIQIMGGAGISREYNLEKYMRDAKMLKIMDGTVDRIALNAVPLL